MNSFKALLKVNFLGMLHLFNGKAGMTGKKKSTSGKFMIFFMLGLSLYISGIYSFLLGSLYGPAGMLDLMLAIMSVIVCLFALMFTAFGASGIVFGGKDMDLMLSLPISSFQVMLSKVLALYLENLMLCAIMMLPCGASYIWNGGGFRIYFIIVLPVLTVFLAVIPTILALIAGYFLTLITGKFGSNALLNNLAYLLFFVIVMFFAFRVNFLLEGSVEKAGGITHTFQTWLLPLWLYIQGILGNAGYAFLFILITTIPFLLIVYGFSRNYKSILSRMSAKVSRFDYHMGSLKPRGAFLSLFQKELGRYWGTPIYLFNTAVGVILIVGGCIYGCIKKEFLTSVLAQVGNAGVLLLLCLIIGFVFAMTCPACVSISLEGKYLWILKEAPVPAKSILMAKGLLNAILIWGTGLVCIPLLVYALNLSGLSVAALSAFCFAFGIFIPAGGLWINLLFPKLDAQNDILVVKQSMSVLVSMFGGMGVIGLGAGAYFLFGKHMPESAFIFGFSAVILAAGMFLSVLLAKNGEKKLLAL